MTPKKQNFGQAMDDLELIRLAILNSRCGPINIKISGETTQSIVKKDPDKEMIESKINFFEKGYRILVEKIVNDAVEGAYSRDADVKPVPIQNFQIPPDMMQIIKKDLRSGSIQPINSICNFSTDVQLLFYETGLYFYEEAFYEQSINSFIFLTMINPNVQAFWIGLGLAYEKNLDFDKAIECFEHAFRSEPTDFYPIYGIIRSCEAIKDFKKIEEFLESEKNNESIKQEIKQAIEYLELNR